MKIEIKAICGEVNCDEENSVVPRSLASSASYQGDSFSEYCDSYYGTVHETVSGGGMDFSYKNGELYVATTYELSREITKEETEKLIEYTQGQWSDGIGEGFEQYPAMTDYEYGDIYISPWYYGQIATATIIK